MSHPPSAAPSPQPDVPARGRGLREVDLLLPLAAAICIALGWHVFLDYERAVAACEAVVPEVAARVGEMRVMMVLLSVGGLGLAGLAARDARRRRRAEAELFVAHAALGRRMARRTDALKSRTKALRESRLRERLAEREAEAAFAAGQVEAAGTYLHHVGNALSAFELELLRLGRALEGAGRLDAAFDALARAIEAGDRAEAGRGAQVLRDAVIGRTFPRLAGCAASLGDLKGRMLGELERHRGEFERRGTPRPYMQAVRLDLELAAILDRMPRAAGSDPVSRDILPEVVVTVRKQPFLAGLAALLRQALDAATDPVRVRLGQGPDRRAVLTLDGVPAAETGEPAVAAFINFLNENGGALRHEPGAAGRPPRLVVEIAEPPRGQAPSAFPGLS
jgi:tetratricopeptide (TPR) repeat protein